MKQHMSEMVRNQSVTLDNTVIFHSTDDSIEKQTRLSTPVQQMAAWKTCIAFNASSADGSIEIMHVVQRQFVHSRLDLIMVINSLAFPADIG